MDKYVLQEKIADGVLGIVHKVSLKDDKSKTPLVMKEIECQDFTSAQNAINEYRIFHAFNNSNICKLRDAFVSWNNKVSSHFVCYIMEYFDKGDLKSHLSKKRADVKVVPIETVQVWLGCIVEGVNFLHQNGLTHRNIKPSSLYVKHDDRLALGDFGVETVMKDARTKTRILGGAFDYIAPEMIDSSQPFDAKSDIW